MQRTLLLSLVAAVLTCAAPACEEEETRPSPAADHARQPGLGAGAGGAGGDASAAGADAGASSSDAAVACNDLVADGPAADQLAVVGEPPVGVGGTIASGTYVLSDARVYGAGGGATGLSYRGALRIDTTTGALDRLLTVSGQNGQTTATRESGTFVASGTNVAVTFSCPSGASEQLTYTASDTTLVLTNIVSRQSFTFTRR